MTRQDILLKQYEIFSQRKIHFGKLFWQIPTVFVATCAFFANVIKDLKGDTLWGFVMVISLLLFLITYIGYRLKINENQYEELMYDMENELYSDGKVYNAHKSEKMGSRFITIAVLFIFAFSLFITGFIKLF